VTYSGDVRTGGPADVRTLDELVLRKLAVGPMANNAYLLTCRRGGAQVLVDAADEPARLAVMLRDASPASRLDLVVTTHQHADHLRGLASVVALTGAAVAAGDADADAISGATGVPVTRRLRHGDTLTVGHLVLEVVALRGHTPGSVALAYREPEHVHAEDAVGGRVHLLTGDSLFPGGVGATGGDGARFDALYRDVVDRVFDRFGDETWVYPGHGSDTTLGAERPHLGQWRARGW
jgi:glyoxylase-like metal-dependent hydrolase (beta-lactamase superfamily II)